MTDAVQLSRRALTHDTPHVLLGSRLLLRAECEPPTCGTREKSMATSYRGFWPLLVALLTLACVAQAADGELRIGFVSPVTGNFAELGTAMRNGGQYAVDAVNAAGGLKVGDKTYTLKYIVG